MSSPNNEKDPLGRCAICGGTALPDPDNLCQYHLRAQDWRDKVTLNEITEFPRRWMPVGYWELQTMPRDHLRARGVHPSLAWQVVFDDIMRRALNDAQIDGWDWGNWKGAA